MILQVPRIAQFIYSQKVPNNWRLFVQLLLKTDDSCTESLPSIQNWKPLKIVSGFKSSSLEFGDSSFMNCRELVEVSFDDPNSFASKSLKKNSNVFIGCENLSKFNFYSNCDARVGDGCFNGCSKLKSVTLQRNLTKKHKWLSKSITNWP